MKYLALSASKWMGGGDDNKGMSWDTIVERPRHLTLHSVVAVRPGMSPATSNIENADFVYLDLHQFTPDNVVKWLEDSRPARLQGTILITGDAAQLNAFDRLNTEFDITPLELPVDIHGSRVSEFIQEQLASVYGPFNYENEGFMPNPGGLENMPVPSEGAKNKKEIDPVYLNPPLALSEEDDQALLRFLQQPESE
jgi:hypothetical protein